MKLLSPKNRRKLTIAVVGSRLQVHVSSASSTVLVDDVPDHALVGEG